MTYSMQVFIPWYCLVTCLSKNPHEIIVHECTLPYEIKIVPSADVRRKSKSPFHKRTYFSRILLYFLRHSVRHLSPNSRFSRQVPLCVPSSWSRYRTQRSTVRRTPPCSPIRCLAIYYPWSFNTSPIPIIRYDRYLLLIEYSHSVSGHFKAL